MFGARASSKVFVGVAPRPESHGRNVVRKTPRIQTCIRYGAACFVRPHFPVFSFHVTTSIICLRSSQHLRLITESRGRKQAPLLVPPYSYHVVINADIPVVYIRSYPHIFSCLKRFLSPVRYLYYAFSYHPGPSSTSSHQSEHAQSLRSPLFLQLGSQTPTTKVSTCHWVLLSPPQC